MIARSLHAIAAALLVVVFPAAMQPQAAATIPQDLQQNNTQGSQPAPAQANATGTPTNSDRRRANKLYLEASKLYVDGKFEEALKQYELASQLDPSNADYRLAADVARSHLVTSLIQSAAKARLSGDPQGATAALRQALSIDPQNPVVTQHLYELSDDVARGQAEPLYQRAATGAGQGVTLLANPGIQSIHVRSDARQVIEQVFRTFGITALVTDTVPATQVRFDIDDADFNSAVRALTLATHTFYVPLDTHQALVARDTRENRTQYARQDVETVYFSGLSNTELTETENLAKNVFNVDQVATNATNSSLTLHGTPNSLEIFNNSMRGLLAGLDQVMLDVRIVQVAHVSTRNTGVQPPQSITAFNVYSEEQAILNANQGLIQQIIAAGLAGPGDTLAILGILLASGQVPNSLFAGGVAFFGGGLTQTGLAPSGPMTLNFSLNSSDTRALDNIQLRLGDGEAGSIKEGTRYPIQTSSYSSVSGIGQNIPGLTGAGSSSGLSALLASLSGATPNIPMIQYQDLGLTLKVTPKVLRGGEVALAADLTLDGLAGSSINGNPILNHEAFSGVVTLKEGEAAELASELTESQSHALSGIPGLTDVPGLNNITNKNVQKNFATLLIILTPHVVRSTQPGGHSPRMTIEKGLTTP